VRLPRRLTASVVASTLLAAGLTGCSSDDESGGGTDVVIGADLASSSATDTAYSRALQLEIDQINSSGQLGDKHLVLRIQDNRADPTASLRNISTFADDPSVAAIVTGECAECIAQAAKTVNEKQVPTIALMPANLAHLKPTEQRWVFKLGPNASDDAAALIAELGRVKAKKIAVLYSDDYYGNDAFNALTGGDKAPTLTKAGIDLVASQKIKPTAVDITQTVGALTDSEPDAFVVLTGPDQAVLAATSAKTAKFKGHLYLDAGAAGDLFIPQGAAAAMENANMVFTQTLVIDDVVATTPAKAARKQWFRDYTSRFGSYNGVAAFAADAASLIADGIARAGTDRRGIRDVLETSQVDALSGPIRLTPDNHSGLMPQALTLLVARSGRWRLATSGSGLQ
jgi:branched-chain amino acid transport system substrate-binding protein